MRKQAAKTTARGLLVAAGAWMLTLAPGIPAGAEPITQSVNETITVPGETPSGFVSVDGETVGIPGAKDVSINIQATGTLGDVVALGTSGGLNCTRLDRSIQLNLDAQATGAVTVNYTLVDPETGVEEHEDEVIPFGGGQTGASPKIALCLR